MINKRCSTCKKFKDIKLFNLCTAYKDGHSYICRECTKVFARKYRETHKDQIHNITDRLRFGGNQELALKRDKYTCQECGMLNEQHIKLFDRAITVDHVDGNGR